MNQYSNQADEKSLICEAPAHIFLYQAHCFCVFLLCFIKIKFVLLLNKHIPFFLVGWIIHDKKYDINSDIT